MTAYALPVLCLFSALSRFEAMLEFCLFSADFDLDFDVPQKTGGSVLTSNKKDRARGRAGSPTMQGVLGGGDKPPKVYQIDTDTAGTLSRPRTPAMSHSLREFRRALFCESFKEQYK